MIAHPKSNPPTLIGKHVRLRPVVASDAATFASITPIETFRYYVTSIPTEQSEAGFEPFVGFILNSPVTLGFACELLETGQVVGSSCYLDIRPEDDHVEIGMTWYAPEWRGTFVNPECKLLLLGYAFEQLGCAKVTIKCDNRNEHSKAAIQKLGAVYEGTLRKHRLNQFGEMRDTAYYGILREEWPAVKAGLEERLKKYES